MKITHRYKNYRNRQTRRYHVSYNFMCFNGTHGFGHIEITLNGSFSINEVASYIRTKNPSIKNVVIISWQKKMCR